MVYYYKNKLPIVDEIVIAKVLEIKEYGILVSLSEYNDVKGFINCGEVSRKKRVNFNKIFTVGKDVLVVVTAVDPDTNHIDVSKRTIGEEDIKLFGEKHKTYIQLYNLFKQIYMRIQNLNNIKEIDQEHMYIFMCLTLWHLQSLYNNENEYISKTIIDKEINMELLQNINLEILNIDNEILVNCVNSHIDTKINKVKSELTETIKLMTYDIDGLANIKYTLDYKSYEDYEKISNQYMVKINYVTNSSYVIILEQKEEESTLLIEDVMCILKTEIKKRAIEKNIQNQISL